ncbi:hypothetical protein TVNIR_2006 [Thioalkalivibrio nitratireducens DSM 14787]|uniref:PilZ domain-containing protein n=1 Tax=Thioalkalivibrio nitratireducens (strain DSM 14787 / UNIQEM 213 / ALEN2) TaxID=1255043 RepID=L0DXD4_THIND|nr:hypothetical protein [Thioalkalivibrio nitratireducens]AGA33667.1 hypothetical protein TVNIR_2006 [Thioalkalivibrio nitratireducens DSM 14787]
MDHHDDECIWVRTDVWLDTGDGLPVKVQTRKLCNSGAFIEYTGPIDDDAVEIIFPEFGSDDGGQHVFGVVAGRWPDGIWVRFQRDLRSSSEMLMRNGLSRAARSVYPSI